MTPFSSIKDWASSQFPQGLLWEDASADLGDVQGVLVPLAVPEDDKDSGLLDGGADPPHLIRVLDKRVTEIFVHEGGIFRGRPGPDAPSDVSN